MTIFLWRQIYIPTVSKLTVPRFECWYYYWTIGIKYIRLIWKCINVKLCRPGCSHLEWYNYTEGMTTPTKMYLYFQPWNTLLFHYCDHYCSACHRYEIFKLSLLCPDLSLYILLNIAYMIQCSGRALCWHSHHIDIPIRVKFLECNLWPYVRGEM